jgi:hypothetical protein
LLGNDWSFQLAFIKRLHNLRLFIKETRGKLRSLTSPLISALLRGEIKGKVRLIDQKA